LRVDLQYFLVKLPALDKVGGDVALAVPAFDLGREVASEGVPDSFFDLLVDPGGRPDDWST
jgi:hypothetical protein